MKNFACWKKESAESLINPDVDAQPDAVFAAVHTDVPIRVERGRRKSENIYDSEEFLDQFLNEADFSLVFAKGQSGAGKSHLVRWMDLRIERNESREVIFVPKAQTNLKQIIRSLVDRLPEQSQQRYLEMLQGAGTGILSESAQRNAFLNSLHTEIANDAGESGVCDPELERYLIDGLGDMFLDPHVRSEVLLSDNSFAAKMAAHVFVSPENYKPADKRREFLESDLPLDASNMKHAARTAQGFLTFLLSHGDETRKAALAIVNRHVDLAISRCLSLSGEQLIELMLEIRRSLKTQGKELVLLIEDFARLQGIDRALLQSLVEHGRGDLCPLRTALACTTGVYNEVPDTVKTRITLLVDMDNPLEDSPASFNVTGMVARYMNAIRLGPDALEARWEDTRGHEDLFVVESHCDKCEHRSTCHDAFGHVNGYGLYPFTKKAIDVMARRADANIDENKRFNSREFQKQVLKPVAELSQEIERGSFPPKSLLTNLGGLGDFPIDEQQRIRDADPQNVDRHLALIALWGGSEGAPSLDQRVQEAFGLEVLNIGGGTKSKVPSSAPSSTSDPKPVTPPWVQELNRWVNDDKRLSQNLANNLRKAIFPAIRDFTNWDVLGCSRAMFMGQAEKIFQQGNISFHNQSTQAQKGWVTLTIPANWADENERATTHAALRGLLESKAARSWSIPDAGHKYACLQVCLERWAVTVSNQFLSLREGPSGWIPAQAALELRLLYVLATTPLTKVPTEAELLKLGISDIGEPGHFVAPEFQKTMDAILSKEARLREMIQSRSATKGGVVGKYIDAPSLVGCLKEFKKRGYRPMPLPSENEVAWQGNKEVFEVSKRVHREWDDSIRSEFAARMGWLDRMTEAFGEKVGRDEIHSKLHDAVSRIANLGGIVGTRETLVALDKVRQSNFDEVIRSTRKLDSDEPRKPWQLAYDAKETMDSSANLAAETDNLLSESDRKLNALLKTEGIVPDESETIASRIKTSLDEIALGLGGESND
jgi:hypothetical protein